MQLISKTETRGFLKKYYKKVKGDKEYIDKKRACGELGHTEQPSI